MAVWDNVQCEAARVAVHRDCCLTRNFDAVASAAVRENTDRATGIAGLICLPRLAYRLLKTPKNNQEQVLRNG